MTVCIIHVFIDNKVIAEETILQEKKLKIVPANFIKWSEGFASYYNVQGGRIPITDINIIELYSFPFYFPNWSGASKTNFIFSLKESYEKCVKNEEISSTIDVFTVFLDESEKSLDKNNYSDLKIFLKSFKHSFNLPPMAIKTKCFIGFCIRSND